MGNARNLSALVPALRGAPGLPIGIPLEAIARHLADVGVSVPSALTDEEAVKIGANAAGTVSAKRSEIALCVHQGLEGIAKGE